VAASRRPPRKPQRAPVPVARAHAAERSARVPQGLAWKLGLAAVWLTLLVPPLLLSPGAKEAFRLPKLMASEWLALASLLFLSWRLRDVATVRWTDLWRRPACRAVLPILLVATAGLATTAHPLHVREGVIDLWIGAAALVGWSLALPAARQEALLAALLWPATALSLLGILQFHHLFEPLQFAGIGYDQRLALTSTAGNPGDLGAYLVLPCLVAQWRLARGGITSRARRARWGVAVALAVCLYALALTQTLAALAALAVGSLVLWGSRSRLGRRRLALAVGGAAALAVVLALAVAPLRARLAAKAQQARQGDWNSVLTGRLDGWRAAVWMLSRHPLAGVGQGAFRPEFVPAKLALLDRGAQFYARQMQPVFANAHDEYLEAAADWGLPGLAALAWALWTLGAALYRRDAAAAGGDSGDGGLAGAGVAALAVLALAYFPFRVALVAFPALFFLSWVLDGGTPREGEDRGDAGGAGAGRGIPGRLLVWPVMVVLALALAGQTARWRQRALAGRLLHQVELLTLSAVSSGKAPRGLLPYNLAALRRAAALDPLEIGVPIARGTQYLEFGSPQEAIESYQAAAALEPRPEIYLNLGRAYLRAGQLAQARRNFRLALRLSPNLAPLVPPEMQ